MTGYRGFESPTVEYMKMSRVCSGCGKTLEDSQDFCPHCGAPAGVPAAPSRTAGSLRRILLLVAGLLILATTVRLGRLYLGHRTTPAKKTVPEATQRGDMNQVLQLLAQQRKQASLSGKAPGPGAPAVPDDLTSLLKMFPGNSGSATRSLPSWKPAPPELLSAVTSRIPLRNGLTVVTAINQSMVGDYESIKQVSNSTNNEVGIKYSANMPYWGDPWGAPRKTPATVTVSSSRTVQRADLETSHRYMQDFVAGLPNVIPGTTAISVSHTVLGELKSKGVSTLTYQTRGFSIGSMLGGGPAPSSGPPQPVDPNILPRATCTLKRVESADVAIPVLVNNQRVQLPAVHVSCSPSGYETAQFYFLDYPENPLALAWQLEQNGDQLQVVKISFPGEVATPQIQQQLATTGRAEVYGIYFDFGSDKIRPESEPVLKEIAEAMTTNPPWRLSVEGHTDNIGGDAYNQALSERRAAAVKQALVERYLISADRLTTVGYGLTRPKEPNGTLEGRARNRRVELVRL